MTFQQKCTNLRDIYIVKKGPTNLGIGNPSPPQFGQLGPLFSGRQNDVLRVWQEKSTNDDNDNCHDNYDSNDGNFDDYDEKITKKTYKYYDFSAKMYQF